jgi:Tfp pilus assembly protein PilX
MKINLEVRPDADIKRKRQQGAALVTVLLISTLLLAMGGTLILVTSLSARTAMDATAEMQAYYSAEAGMQDAMNVLRGNVAPNAAMPAGTKISFRNAITASKSNLPGDNSTSFRLSGWLNYNYTSSGQSSADRVGLTPSYNPTNGLAYSVTVSDPDSIPVATGEPNRLVVRVSGYGPKGAQKRLELVVNRSNFNYAPPAMLMMVGANDCSAMTFTIGQSNAKDYSGHDATGTGVLPAFGSTCNGDHTIELNSDGKETVDEPKAQNVGNSDLPPWLRSADEARAFLADQKSNAITQGRYFTSFSGNSGSSTDPAFTFVDGDATLDGGAGLLIVTGNLTMSGNPSFNGLILVLGNGHVERNGGGNGDIMGAVVVARFNSTGGFLQPFFDTNGGGNSTMQYDSNALRQALNVSGPRVMGVHEY